MDRTEKKIFGKHFLARCYELKVGVIKREILEMEDKKVGRKRKVKISKARHGKHLAWVP